jgi:hypothetical protein
MYARTTVTLIPGPIDAAAIYRLRTDAVAAPQSRIVVQLPGRSSPVARRLAVYLGLRRGSLTDSTDGESEPAWAGAARLRIAKSYSLPNGRRYALLELQP